MYRCVEALSTESATNDWIFGERWDFFFGTEDMRSEAASISGESLRRDSHPSVQEEARVWRCISLSRRFGRVLETTL